MLNNQNSTFIENNFPIAEISRLALKEGNSKRPVYQIHKWWARRLSSIVRGLIIGSALTNKHTEEDFWNAFYGKNKLNEYTIMDIFMGGGSSLVEAKKTGAKTIGIDIDPMACFVTQKELEHVDFLQLKKTYNIIEKKLAAKIRSFYITKVNGETKPIINFFWVYSVVCPECETSFDAHPHYKVYNTDKEQGVVCKCCGKLSVIDVERKILVCKNCNKRTQINKGPFIRGKCTCPSCKEKFNLKDYVHGTQNLKMFALEYEDKGKRFYKEISVFDQEKLDAVNQEYEIVKKELLIPSALISIENDKDKRPLTHGYNYYSDLFNKRQLLSLGYILNEIANIDDENIKSWFILAFSDSLASNNILCSYAFGYRKLTPLFGIHAYTVPSRPVETNVWGTGGLGRGSFEKTFNKMIKSKTYCKKPYEIKIKNNKSIKVSTGEVISSIVTNDYKTFYENKADTLIMNQSSEKLDNIINKSVDLILTDPPYYDNLHYSHLADFYFQWLKNFIQDGKTNPTENSLFAQNNNEETYNTFKTRLENIFKESCKKLSDNGMMVFSYHHNKQNAWKAIGEALKNSNFIITKIFPIRSEGSSAYHSGEKTIKWDSILIVRKKTDLYESTKIEFKDFVEEWTMKIQKDNLSMNSNDKLSFFRSLAVQYYVNYNIDFNELFQEEVFKKAF